MTDHFSKREEEGNKRSHLLPSIQNNPRFGSWFRGLMRWVGLGGSVARCRGVFEVPVHPEAALLPALVFATPKRPSAHPPLHAHYVTRPLDHLGDRPSSVTPATDDVCYQGTLVLRQPLSSHSAMGTLVVLLTSQIPDLRTKVTVGNRKGAMLTWPFQNVPSSGSLSPSFTDGSLLTTESVSSWMWVHWCYPILK